MHSIITVELFYQGPKTQECGMLWVVVIKKLERVTKPKDVILGLRTVRIEKVLQFIKWVNCIIRWVQPTS